MDFVCLIYILQMWIFPTFSIPLKDSDAPIRCFDCSFDLKNEHCDDRFSTIGVKVANCTGSCVKVKMYDTDKGKVYGRYCSPTREKEQCRVTDAGKKQRMEECYCNKDLCNAAHESVFSDIMTSIITILLGCLLKTCD